MNSNAIIDGILITIVVMLIVVVVLLCFFIINKWKENVINDNIATYIQLHEKVWYDYLVNNGPIVQLTKRANELDAIDRIFVSFITTINNAEVRERVSKYCSLKMHNYYLQQFNSKSWAIRMNLLNRILLFELAFLVPKVESHLKHNRVQTIEEYILILRIVAKYNNNLFLAHFYKPRFIFTEYEYKVILAQIDENYIPPLKENFHQLPITLRLALIDYLRLDSNNQLDDLQFYEHLLTSYSPEVRIRALKAIATIGTISTIEKYFPFVDSQEWEERLMVAKIFGYVSGEELLNYLQGLIKDANWNVRKQAALTLKESREGIEILQRIIQSEEDIYASHIAREVLKVG